MLPHKTIFTTMAAHAAAILAEGVRQAQTVGGVTPPFEMIKTSTFAYAQDVAKGWLVPGLIELFQKSVDAHVKAMGPRPQTAVDDPDNKAWCDLFDETIMDAIGQDLLRDIGQDFIGEWLTESEFDNPDTLTRAAQIAAARLIEVAIQMPDGKGVKARSPGQVLAEIGIVHDQIAAYAMPGSETQSVTAANVVTPVTIDTPTARAHVEGVVGRWAIGIGMAAFDVAVATELLKGALDDDEVLCLGFVERLGGTKADAPYFVTYFKAEPTTCIDATVSAALMASMTGVVTEPPKGTKKPKAPTKKELAAAAKANAVAPPPPTATVATVEKANYLEVVKLLREARLATDEDLGKLIGVSRAQVANIVTKDKPVSLSRAQITVLNTAVEERVRVLTDALTLLS